LRQYLVGNLLAGGDVVAFYLNVHRRGNSEVENLRRDVGRKKVEGGAGKLARQFIAQIANIVRCRVMVGLERDFDVGVVRSNRTTGQMLHVRSAVGKADVVQNVVDLGWRDLLANVVLNQVAELCRLLDARA